MAAKAPHNTKRPASARVRKAVEEADKEALAIALTPRQRAFCHEYVVDFKGKEAAIRAGYSPKWAEKQAYLLRMNEGVQSYIDHLLQSTGAKVTTIDPDYIVSRITRLVDEAERTGQITPALRGLEMLARHLGMFVEKTEISGPDGNPIQIQKTKEDAETFIFNLKQMAERHKNEKIDVVID